MVHFFLNISQFGKIGLPLFFLIVTGCQGQDKSKSSGDKTIKNDVLYEDIDYLIGDYKINPHKKEISSLVEVGGVTWDGVAYQKLTDVTFDTTSLIFLGNQLLFKEFLPSGCDLETLEVINSNEFATLYKDKNKIYVYASGMNYPAVDISQYESINNYLYKDKNGSMWSVVDVSGGGPVKFVKIFTDENIDGTTYKNINMNFSYDKNGLYYITPKYDDKTQSYNYNLIKICSGKENFKAPFIAKNYVVYNSCVYSLKSGAPLKLNLDRSRMIEIKPEYGYNQSYLSDGKQVYKALNLYGYDTIAASLKELKHQVLNDVFVSGLDIEYLFSDQIAFYIRNNSELIFCNGNDKICNNATGRLIKTSQGYYFLPTDSNYKKAKKIKNVFIYNAETQKEEIFEIGDFKYLKEGFFIYKKSLYRNSLVPTNLDLKKTQIVQNVNVMSNFLTDGKLLYYRTKLVPFTGSSQYNLNISKIKIVNPDIIILDDSVIVSKTSIIPIKKLGIEVKICTAQ